MITNTAMGIRSLMGTAMTMGIPMATITTTITGTIITMTTSTVPAAIGRGGFVNRWAVRWRCLPRWL